jgi:hypothetical protein
LENFLKNYATPLVVAVFLGLATSGLMMFFGLAKEEVHDLHRWIGIGFVVVAVLHIVWNWRGLTVRLRQGQAVVVIGAVVIALGALIGLKQFGPEEEGRHGGGQIMAVLAHQPIASVAPALGMSADEAVARLKAKGIAVTSASQSLDDVARASHAEVPRLLGAMVGGAQDED